MTKRKTEYAARISLPSTEDGKRDKANALTEDIVI
jgi:hypothetical protein